MKTEQIRSKLWRSRYLLILTILTLFTGASIIAFGGLTSAAAPPKSAARQQVQPQGKSSPPFSAHVAKAPRSSIAAPLGPSDRVPPPSVLYGKAGAHDMPNDVLYDQYDFLAISTISSQNFEPAYDQYDSQAADDFFVPGGQTWLVNEVDVAGAYTGNGRADSVNVIFYASAGNLPGAPVFTATNIVPASGLGTGDFAVVLDQPATLTVGTYWVSVQANERLNPNGQWFWRNRATAAYNEAAWRNPGDGFFTPCTTEWGIRALNCGLGWDAPDQVFRLIGTFPPSPTPTGTPPTATDTPTGTPPTSTDTPTDTPTAADTGTPTPTNTEAATVPIPVSTAVATVIQDTPTPQPPCGLLWRIVDSPNPGPISNYLYDVATISATDIWAVGWYTDPNFYQNMLTMHWDGSTWTVVPVPQSFLEGSLAGVAAESSNNVWAVGDVSQDGYYYNGVILHWDGSAWTDMTPAGLPQNSYLNDVTVLAPGDAWAVGSYYDEYGDSQTLTVHWNGSTWSTVSSPNNGYTSWLSSVSGSEPNDVWAVGSYNDYSYQQPFTIHWNGAQWSIVDTISTGDDAQLYGVSVFAPNDVWAVGYYFYDFYDNTTLTIHWDGSSWSYVPSPQPDQESTFHGVQMLAPDDVWAVGDSTYYDGIEYTTRTLTARWDGTEWTQVTAPDPAGSSLASIGAVSPDDLWAVGTVGSYSPSSTLVERYFDPCATPTPTVTGTPPTATATRTRIPSPPPTSTPTPTVPPGPDCPGGYADLPPDNPDFAYAHCATCAGILETFACGYSPGEPCIPPDNYPYFRPATGFEGTRGEVAKSVSNAAGFSDLPQGQLFEDIPVDSTYYTYTYRLGIRGIEVGFPCGGVGEPCVPPANLPYYRPYVVAVRGEFTRFVSNAAGFNEDHTDQLFEDVPLGSDYYIFVERIASRNLMQGFPCGGPGEPCVPPNNLPYFRPTTDLTTLSRLQIAHILVDTFLPGCPLTTPTPVVSPTNTPTNTPTSSITPTGTSTIISTNTPTITPTQMSTTEPSQTPPGDTATPVPTNMPTFVVTPTTTPTIQPTACTVEFTDVLPGSTFYPYIHCLACRGIINGYSNGSFKPNNDVTRGQLSKIVSNSAGFSSNQANQMFQDVPVGSTFFQYIGRLASRGYISGYGCGGPGEPCVPPARLPYFRPNNNATRGQISKIVSNAAGFIDTPNGQQFQDVAIGSTYYAFTYRLTTRNIMQGYACGGTGEPCISPANLPYFRPNNNATRGQTSKIDGGAFFPDCQTP